MDKAFYQRLVRELRYRAGKHRKHSNADRNETPDLHAVVDIALRDTADSIEAALEGECEHPYRVQESENDPWVCQDCGEVI